MMLRNNFLAVVCPAVMVMALGCEGVTHENLDKWGHTEKGPGKLLDALEDREHSADLRAHAAQTLVELGRFPDVKLVLEAMEEGARHQMVNELAERLWDTARINDAMAVPNSRQIVAKDALFYIVTFADTATKAKIADYLVEWFVGGYFEGRATTGSVSSTVAIRWVGARAAPRLLESTQAIVDAPPDAKGRRTKVGNERLRALALTGDPAGLQYLLTLSKGSQGDPSLPERAIAAIHFAFVEPVGIDPVPGTLLIPVSEPLAKLPYDQEASPQMRNDAVEMLVAIGSPECIPFFTAMISRADSQSRYRWIGTQKGIRCAGIRGIEAITLALPPDVKYERGLLDKYLWQEIYKLGSREEIAAAAERLLTSPVWVARVTGLELLLRVGTLQNLASVKAIGNDRYRLKGWWGAQSSRTRSERKPEPTIGELAANVAQKLASGPENK